MRTKIIQFGNEIAKLCNEYSELIKEFRRNCNHQYLVGLIINYDEEDERHEFCCENCGTEFNTNSADPRIIRWVTQEEFTKINHIAE